MRFQYVALALALSSSASARAGYEYLDNEYNAPAPNPTTTSCTKGQSNAAQPTSTTSAYYDPEEYGDVSPEPNTTSTTTTTPYYNPEEYGDVAPGPATTTKTTSAYYNPEEYGDVSPEPATTKSCTKGQNKAAQPTTTTTPYYNPAEYGDVAPGPHTTTKTTSAYYNPEEYGDVSPEPHTTKSCTKGQSNGAEPQPTTTPYYNPEEYNHIVPVPHNTTTYNPYEYGDASPEPTTTSSYNPYAYDDEEPSVIAEPTSTKTPCTKGKTSTKAGEPTGIPDYVTLSPEPTTSAPVSYKTTVTEYDTEIVTKPCSACAEKTYYSHVTKTITVPCGQETPVYPTDGFSTIPEPKTYDTYSSTRTHTYTEYVTVPKPQEPKTVPYEEVPAPSYSTVTIQSTLTVATQTGTHTSYVPYETPSYETPSHEVPSHEVPSYEQSTFTKVPVPTYTPPAPVCPGSPHCPSGNQTVPVPPPTYTGAAGKVQTFGVVAAGAMMAFAAFMNL